MGKSNAALWSAIVVAVTVIGMAGELSGQQAASAPASRPAGRKVKITISKETTFLDGPVNPDGTINYVAAVNQRMAKGVTKDNNAAIPMLNAFGPASLNEKTAIATCKALGVEMPPEKGDYFIRLSDYVNSLPADRQPKPTVLTDDQKSELEKFLKERQACQRAKKEEPDGLDIRIDRLSAKTPVDIAGLELRDAFRNLWQDKNHPVIDGWLKANDKALAAVVEATTRPRYYFPCLCATEPQTTLKIILPPLAHVREAAKALAARAMRRLSANDITGAEADLMACHRLARLIDQHVPMIARLVGLAIDSVAHEGDKALAASGKLSAEQARQYLRQLQELPALPSFAEAIDQCERFVGSDIVVSLAGERDLEGVIASISEAVSIKLSSEMRKYLKEFPLDDVDWNQILRTQNRYYDQLSSMLSDPTSPTFKSASEKWDVEMMAMSHRATERIRRAYFDELPPKSEGAAMDTEALSDLLIPFTMPSSARAGILHVRVLEAGKLSQIAFALAAYKAEKGLYPAKLEDLAPAYNIKTIPPDAFSGKPLSYRLQGSGYILYSVGENQKDDGGKSSDDAIGADDIVVRVPAAPAVETRQ